MSTATSEVVEQVKRLPSEDKLPIIDELWESIPAEDVPIPDEVLAEMDRRYEELKKNPGRAQPWSAVEKRIREAQIRV